MAKYKIKKTIFGKLVKKNGEFGIRKYWPSCTYDVIYGDVEIPTEDEVKKPKDGLMQAKVKDLQSVCASMGIPKSGTKQEIVNRLLKNAIPDSLELLGIPEENRLTDKEKTSGTQPLKAIQDRDSTTESMYNSDRPIIGQQALSSSYAAEIQRAILRGRPFDAGNLWSIAHAMEGLSRLEGGAEKAAIRANQL